MGGFLLVSRRGPRGHPMPWAPGRVEADEVWLQPIPRHVLGGFGKPGFGDATPTHPPQKGVICVRPAQDIGFYRI